MTGIPKKDRLAIARLITHFGADILVDRREPAELTRDERDALRVYADLRVEGCTSCELHVNPSSPISPWWGNIEGPRSRSVAVVNDAPALEEWYTHELGHGWPAQTARTALTRAGLDPERITWLTAAACTPLILPKSPRGRPKRTVPGREHVATCRPNLLASLAAAETSYVLLLGGLSVAAWRPDLKLADVIGRWFLWNNRWMVFCADHPAVTRVGGDVKEADRWRAHLNAFSTGVDNGVGIEVLGNAKCIVTGCDEGMHAMDDDGVPWCAKHEKVGKMTAQGRKSAKKMPDTAQGKML